MPPHLDISCLAAANWNLSSILRFWYVTIIHTFPYIMFPVLVKAKKIKTIVLQLKSAKEIKLVKYKTPIDR